MKINSIHSFRIRFSWAFLLRNCFFFSNILLFILVLYGKLCRNKNGKWKTKRKNVRESFGKKFKFFDACGILDLVWWEFPILQKKKKKTSNYSSDFVRDLYEFLCFCFIISNIYYIPFCYLCSWTNAWDFNAYKFLVFLFQFLIYFNPRILILWVLIFETFCAIANEIFVWSLLWGLKCKLCETKCYHWGFYL